MLVVFIGMWLCCNAIEKLLLLLKLTSINEYIYGLINILQSDKKKLIDPDEARMWADSKGFHFFETSAFNGDGIQEMFQVKFTLAYQFNFTYS